MEQLSEVLAGIQKTYPSDVYPLSALAGKFAGFMKSQMTAEEKLSALVKAATELTSQEAPKWENIAGNLLAFQFNSRLKKEEEDRKLWSLYDKIRYLTAEGLYGAFILENYSREEICLSLIHIYRSASLLPVRAASISVMNALMYVQRSWKKSLNMKIPEISTLLMISIF